VVSGTANAMQNRAIRKRQGYEAEALQNAQQTQPASPTPAPAAPAPVGGADLTVELAKLAELHSAGLLTAEEFSAAKARLLA
jgi:hypothetical protein